MSLSSEMAAAWQAPTAASSSSDTVQDAFEEQLLGINSVDFGTHIVHQEDEQWKAIERRIHESLPEYSLVSMIQVFERRLYREFKSKKMHMTESIGCKKLNSKYLFHGAADDSRQITGSGFNNIGGNGFDFRLSKGGAYGRGAYFAKDAFYPVKIHPFKEKEGIITLLVAEVLLGVEKDYQDVVNDETRNLARPPVSNDGVKRYDSVSGTETKEYGRQHIIYDKSQAYPKYEITIRANYQIISLADDPVNCAKLSGWELCCHSSEPDIRNSSSSYILAHNPSHPGSRGSKQWMLKLVKGSRYTIVNYAPKERDHLWELACHVKDPKHCCQSNKDYRNDYSSYVMAHKDAEKWEGTNQWNIIKVDNDKFKIVFHNPESGCHNWELCCHTTISTDHRNGGSYYVIIHDPDHYDTQDITHGNLWRFSPP